MIRDFWVQNYLSIRDKLVMDFTNKRGDDNFLVYEVSPGVFLNKIGILYGANASGKSNILLAIQRIFSLLLQAKTDAEDLIGKTYPFALTKEAPVQMHVSFYADSIRYDYDVVFNRNYILSEELYYYPNSARALFYQRKFNGADIQANIEFGASLKLRPDTKKRIIEETLNNHSVLSVCRKKSFTDDIQPFTVLYNWIRDNVQSANVDGYNDLIKLLRIVAKDEKQKMFFYTMLKKAGLNIISYQTNTDITRVPKNLLEQMEKEEVPQEIKNDLIQHFSDSISFTNTSSEGNFEIPLGLQSRGTIKYLSILSNIYGLITKNQISLLDELGEDLHYDLLLYLLNVFIYNSNQSQLIFTSQDTSVLMEDLLNDNRNLVWFVEKDNKTASSSISRADSMGLHKNLSLYNAYKHGRLGAKPDLGSFFIGLD